MSSSPHEEKSGGETTLHEDGDHRSPLQLELGGETPPLQPARARNF